MLQTWVSRFLAVVFLIEVVCPASVVNAAVTAAPSTRDISARISKQVSSQKCIPQQEQDERWRAADPFRQTELAKEIVCKHQQGAKNDSGDGFAARGKKIADKSLGEALSKTRYYDEALASSTAVRNIPKQPILATDLKAKSDPASTASATDDSVVMHTSMGGGMKTTVVYYNPEITFDSWVVSEIEARIQSPDFTLGDLLDFMDPYDPSGYSPLVTTVAAEAMSVWLQYLFENYKDDEDVLEGIALFASEIEQRALYRLAFLKHHPGHATSLDMVRAIGSLYLMLESLYIFENELITNHPDLYGYYNKDSIFSVRLHGAGIGALHFRELLSSLSTEINKLSDDSNPGALLNNYLNYAIMFALMRDRSGLLVSSSDGSPIPNDRWNSIETILGRISKTVKAERYTSETPWGKYLQTSTVLYSLFAGMLQQNLTEQDLTGTRGENLIKLLKQEADFSKKSTGGVVAAVEVASFLIRDRQMNFSLAERQYFANAIESVYCRSAVGHQSYSYNKQGVKQHMGTSVSGLENMLQIRFEDFGFQDVKQHATFMQGIAKIHESFGTSRTVYKPVDPAVDRLVYWEDRPRGNVARHTKVLPDGDFYFKCVLDNNYKQNPILEMKEVGKIIGTVLLEIFLWVAFDGAFRVVGRFVSPIFRSGVAGIQALPRAIATAGKAARTGRMAGIAAGARELREAVVLAGKMSKVQARGGSIAAVTMKNGQKVIRTEGPATHVLSGPGVPADAAVPFVGKRETLEELIPTERLWTSWRDPRNRYFFGFGAMREDISYVTLRQGSKSITLDMKALGLEKGIHRLGDWNKLMAAAKQGGFEFKALSGAALRQARVEAYMSAVAAQKLSAQNWLTRNMPGATKYWKYGGEDVGWQQVSQKEFMEWYEGLVRSQAEVTALKTEGKAVTDYYAVLGVPRTATTKEIQQAWKHRMLTEHPDKGGVTDFASELNEAYNVLRNAKKRAAFDRLLSAEEMGVSASSMLENEAAQSLAITLDGKVFNGTNGIAFGASNKEVWENLPGAVQKYMTENNMYSSFKLNLAKLPPYWQGSYYSVTRVLPFMYAADYFTEDHLRDALQQRVEGEQRAFLAPLQPRWDEFQAKKQALAEKNPAVMSLYDQVSAIEPLVGTFWGMPYLSFAGSSLFTLLYHPWDKAIEPLSPWKWNLMSKEAGQQLVGDATYALAKDQIDEAMKKKIMPKSTENVLNSAREQRDESVAQITKEYGVSAAQEVAGYWDNYIEELQKVLMKGLSGEEQQTELEKLNDILTKRLEVCGVLAQIMADKTGFMAQFARLPGKEQNKISSLYDNYYREVKGILEKTTNPDKQEKLIAGASDRLLDKVAKVSPEAKVILMNEASKVAASRMAVPQGITQEIDIEDEPDFFAEAVYGNYMKIYGSVYSDEVYAQLEEYRASALKKMDAIVADESLSLEQKWEQLQDVETKALTMAGDLLRVNEPDYERQFAQVRQRIISAALFQGDVDKTAQIRALLDEKEAQFNTLLAKLANKKPEERRAQVDQFYKELQSQTSKFFTESSPSQIKAY